MLDSYENSGKNVEDLKSESVNNKLLKVALKVCKKCTRELDELIDDANGFDNLVSDAEWKVLSADEMNEEELQ